MDGMNFQLRIPEPVFQFVDLSSIVVVDMLPGAENLDLLDTASQNAVQQRHGQALFNKKISRKCVPHGELRSLPVLGSRKVSVPR